MNTNMARNPLLDFPTANTIILLPEFLSTSMQERCLRRRVANGLFTNAAARPIAPHYPESTLPHSQVIHLDHAALHDYVV